MFCHNGTIQGFSTIKRKILAQLTEESFKHIKGTTDSEVAFALILTNLSKDGLGLSTSKRLKRESPFEQKEPFGHDRLYQAVKRTIRQIEHILKISGIQDDLENFPDPSRLNFSLTDGYTTRKKRNY